MGTVISKTANGIGTLLGNAFVAPLKAVFGGSCEGVCSGTWDITCFIEHMCVSDLVKLLMVLGLCYITLMFFYLMFELGICQCIGRSLCRMCWAACETYWFTLEDFTCFLCHKLKNVKWVNHRRRRLRRFRDVELGCSSSEENTSLGVDRSVIRRRKLIRKRKDRPESTFYPLRQVPKNRYGSHNHHHHHHHHLRLKTREVSVHVKGRSQGAKYSRQLQIRKLSNIRREAVLFKKRRFR